MPEQMLALSRRDVLRAGLGGALLLGVHFATSRVALAQEVSDGVFAPDAFIRIDSSGATTLIMPQVEMGQGIYTALTMLIAEELDLDMETVRLEAAPPSDALYGNPIFQIQATGGSTSVRAFWVPLRTAGATARAMLIAAAAQQWGVDASTCSTDVGKVVHAASGRSAPYGELAVAAGQETPPATVALKQPSDYRLIGKTQRRLDTPGKVNGSLKYGIDAMPEGLSFATLASSPVPGGKVASFDEAAARAVRGVRQIINLDDLVAVVADNSWAAQQGLAALDIGWDDGEFSGLTTELLRAGLDNAAEGEGVVAKNEGDAIGALKGDGVISARYDLPMLAHAPMEPMNCTVHLTDSLCEIWVGTQVMTKAQSAAAEESGLRPDQILIHNHLIGGGFGRRLEIDSIRKAVRIARQVEGPVKIFWTREEDIQNAMYRSIYGTRLSARLENGKPVAWSHKIVGPSIIARWLPPAFANGIDVDAIDGAAETPYDFPNFRVEYVRHELPGFQTCFWRGVGPNVNVFSIESFVDRLARESGTDPVDFRRSIIGKQVRARAVLDLAAEKAGWGTPLAEGSGRGVSLGLVFGSYLSTVAEVAVDKQGGVQVKRLVCAVDCGTAVDPDNVVAQIQGGMVFGLTAALWGDITVAKGRVQQSNFHDYRMLRINEMPQIEVHLVRNEESPGGIGEAGTVLVQPAVANAVSAATGVAITKLPIVPTLLARGDHA